MSELDLLAPVVCGIAPDGTPRHADDPTGCPRWLFRTYGPAGSLWCPVHGHVLDVFPSPPLTGTVHLNFGGGRGMFVPIEAIEAGLV